MPSFKIETDFGTVSADFSRTARKGSVSRREGNHFDVAIPGGTMWTMNSMEMELDDVSQALKAGTLKMLEDRSPRTDESMSGWARCQVFRVITDENDSAPTQLELMVSYQTGRGSHSPDAVGFFSGGLLG